MDVTLKKALHLYQNNKRIKGLIEKLRDRISEQPFRNNVVNCYKKRTPDDQVSKSAGYILYDYMMLFLGSCLVGVKKEDSQFNIGFGAGANGKSVIQQCMANVLGQFAGTVSSSVFTTKITNPDAPTPSLSAMEGKRFVYMSEIQKGTEFNEALIKILTGSDTVTVRKLYQEATTMKPQFKILMVVNDLPKFRGGEYSMQRQLAVIPFVSQFVEDSSKWSDIDHAYKKDTKLDCWMNELPVKQALI
ncbi:hypothetical protein HDU81_010385 [Chytriomyces hyalinus]|nr:hypothetical protein HDU81_010385 [Chytriomyces hyalinus]